MWSSTLVPTQNYCGKLYIRCRAHCALSRTFSHTEPAFRVLFAAFMVNVFWYCVVCIRRLYWFLPATQNFNGINYSLVVRATLKHILQVRSNNTMSKRYNTLIYKCYSFTFRQFYGGSIYNTVVYIYISIYGLKNIKQTLIYLKNVTRTGTKRVRCTLTLTSFVHF